MISKIERLQVNSAELRRRLDPATLPFETTAEVEPLEGTIGQPRALDAIEFGLEIKTAGYNLYAAGAPGSGRESTVRDYLERHAHERPVPDDWVYVHNFRDPDRPLAIPLPPGRGSKLQRDMESFVEEARREIPRAFEGEEYVRRRQEALAEVERRSGELREGLEAFAGERGYALQWTPAGIVTAPVVDGRPLTPEDVERLAPEERERLDQHGEELRERGEGTLRKLRRLEKEAAERTKELDREVALLAVGPLLDEVRRRWSDEEDVRAFLDAVQADLPEHLADFRPQEGEQPAGLAELSRLQRGEHLARYEVNVLVDNSHLAGAPIVIERNPTYYNLAEQYSPVPTATLRPEPIPLELKVILIGPPLLYHLLYALDEDFRELFKVKVDFAADMDWSDEHVANYAAFISRCVRSAGLRHFDRSAVARVVEHGARVREHQGKLSARLLEIFDMVAEASFWAGKAGREVVSGEDVDTAVARKEYRSNLLEERVQELIGEGTLLIDVEGEQVGQVNGLAVAELGDYRFGRPTRVTARVSLGRGAVESIEREIELSGPIHSKGFLILSGYLAENYAQEWPLALKATIAFEQSYDEVEGDSASATELYALLSALSGLPLRQGIAVTGSVNQHGEIQAVGAISRKVEGFFATCKAKGLTGEQGVMVPAANLRHLMLADEVVEAVERGEFHLWAVRTVDEGIELLTGRPAGKRDDDRRYRDGTVHRLVEDRLRHYAERLRSFASDGFVERAGVRLSGDG